MTDGENGADREERDEDREEREDLDDRDDNNDDDSDLLESTLMLVEGFPPDTIISSIAAGDSISVAIAQDRQVYLGHFPSEYFRSIVLSLASC